MEEKNLSGKIAIISGANQGLGKEIAKSFVKEGANVMLCARNQDLLEDTKKDLIPLLEKNQKIIIKKCDIKDKNQIKKLVKDTIENLGGCHILVNNAGIYGPFGAFENQDWDDWEEAIKINLFGSILMCREIIPHFKKQKYGKIIQLSGGGATKPMPNFSVYATSKAGIVRFSETLAEELKNFGIDVNSIAPGALNTKMLQDVLDAGPEKVGIDFYKKSLKQKNDGGTPLKKTTDLALFLASSESNGITGKLISAQWDDWKNWKNYKKDLRKSDVYTLRRIQGIDRGFKWGDILE